MRTPTLTVLAIAALAGIATAQEPPKPPNGASLFAAHCAACHGAEGEGGGPVASVMSISVPNLRSIAMRNGGAFKADDVAAYIDGRKQRAAHGSRTMPIWGEFLEEADARDEEASVRARIAALVAFIETLQYR